MKRSTRRTCSIASAFLLMIPLIFCASTVWALTYRITPYSEPGILSNTQFNGINNAGHYVGYTSLSGVPVGFLQTGRTFPGDKTDLPQGFIPYGINTSDHIVGSTAAGLAFVKTGVTPETFSVTGASFTRATGINDSGRIVGWYNDGGGTHGFLKVGDEVTTIDFPFATTTQAYGINNEGTIVGFYGDGTSYHGFVRVPDGGSISKYDPGPPGATNTQLVGINNSGHIVGSYFLDSLTHGFIDVGGTITVIDIPGIGATFPYGVNDFDQVTGSFMSLLVPFGGFEANPVPLPASLFLFGPGLIGIGMMRRRLRRIRS